MSVHWIARVWDLDEQPPLPAGQRLVLMALADHANGDGVCWPTWDRLAAMCRLSRRRIQQTVGALRERGLLEVRVRRVDGRQRSNHIRLLFGPAGVKPASPLDAGSGVKPASPLRGEIPGAPGVKPASPRGVKPASPSSTTEPTERTNRERDSLFSDSTKPKKTGPAPASPPAVADWTEQTEALADPDTAEWDLGVALLMRKRRPAGCTAADFAAMLAGGIRRGRFERADLLAWWTDLGPAGDHDCRPVELDRELTARATARRKAEAAEQACQPSAVAREVQQHRARLLAADRFVAAMDPAELTALRERVVERLCIAEAPEPLIRTWRDADPAASPLLRRLIYAELEPARTGAGG